MKLRFFLVLVAGLISLSSFMQATKPVTTIFFKNMTDRSIDIDMTTTGINSHSSPIAHQRIRAQITNNHEVLFEQPNIGENPSRSKMFIFLWEDIASNYCFRMRHSVSIKPLRSNEIIYMGDGIIKLNGVIIPLWISPSN